MAASISHSETEVFELLVGNRASNGYPLTITASPAGEATATCALDSAAFELQDALAALAAGDTDAEFLRQFGAFLFEELFVGEIAALYHTSLQMARSHDKHLRVRLRMEPPELAALPWEYLYDQREDAFLAISAENALVRAVPLRLPIRPLRVKLPLRVLVVLANPRDLPTLQVDQEKALIQEALAQGSGQGQVALHFVEKATVANISQALRSVQPHIFHFVGHGQFTDERTFLVLEDDAEQAHLIDDQLFREFFAGSNDTRLVVLNACQSATTSSSQPLVGLAPQLLQRQLSAVVAMQYPIADRSALIFVREFYRTLALGYGVDAAVSEARKGLFLEIGPNAPDWGIPVLFLRAKDGQIFQVETAAAPNQLEIPPPPEPTRPPPTPGFIGRAAELTMYAQTLKQSNLAVIAGMAGAGKTSLAAILAQQVSPSERIFWHSFHPGEGLEEIIWKLAGFLAWHGKVELWRMLQGAHRQGSQPPPLEMLFEYALQMARGQNYLICLDDFQYVDSDPMLEDLMERLQTLLAARELCLLITSRRLPDFARSVLFKPLAGLNAADTRALLRARGLQLDETLVEKLHSAVEGNTELLIMSIDALQATAHPARLIERLARADNIERYLLDELDRHLSEEERRVESTVAVLGYPSTRNAIETTLSQRNLHRTLHGLCERYLLTHREGEQAQEYDQHSILRAFYYEQPEPNLRQAMHRRAAEYYESEENNLFKAAWHYTHAGDHKAAAELLVNNVWLLINRGQVRALSQLLERCDAAQLSLRQWAEVNLARGEVYTFLGKSEQAQASYTTAQAVLAKAPAAKWVRILKAQVGLGMGELLRETQPEAARHWLQSSLVDLPDQQDILAAELLIRLGGVQIILSQQSEAQANLQQALVILANRPSHTYIGALENLGSLYFYQGNLVQAVEQWEQGATLSRRTYNQFKLLSFQNNLGVTYMLQGDWARAFTTFEQGIVLAKPLGAVNTQALFHLNLGILCTRQGNDEPAQEHLIAVLDLARASNLREYESHAHFSLADLRLRQGDTATAVTLLSAAEAITTAAGITYQLPEIYRLWATAQLALDNPAAALAYSQKAVESSQPTGMSLEEGMAQCVLGQALHANRKSKLARAAFQRSQTLIADQEPYEAARLKLAWAQTLSPSRAKRQQQHLLQGAQATFQRLGAQRDLATVLALFDSDNT